MKLTSGDKHIISNIVGRLHVSSTEEEVLDYLASRFIVKDVPKEAKRYALKVHHANQGLYTRVMRGGF